MIDSMPTAGCPNCGQANSFNARIDKVTDKPHATPGGMPHWENHTCSNCGHKFGIRFEKAEHNR